MAIATPAGSGAKENQRAWIVVCRRIGNCRVKSGHAVVLLVRADVQLIAQADVQSQSGRDLPVVLREKRMVRKTQHAAKWHGKATLMQGAKHEARERVS